MLQRVKTSLLVPEEPANATPEDSKQWAIRVDSAVSSETK